MPGNYMVPPVQPMGQRAPGSTIPMKPQPQQPGQGESPDQQAQEDQADQNNMILVGGLIEALIQKGLITEEDVHNGIAMLHDGGGNPQEPGQEPGNKKGGGYPGAADTEKSMGAEHGKMSSND